MRDRCPDPKWRVGGVTRGAEKELTTSKISYVGVGDSIVGEGKVVEAAPNLDEIEKKVRYRRKDIDEDGNPVPLDKIFES
ncbi:MAG: hypothetical protein WCX97_03710 [Candidatus Magasanikbacteria bacterium]